MRLHTLALGTCAAVVACGAGGGAKHASPQDGSAENVPIEVRFYPQADDTANLAGAPLGQWDQSRDAGMVMALLDGAHTADSVVYTIEARLEWAPLGADSLPGPTADARWVTVQPPRHTMVGHLDPLRHSRILLVVQPSQILQQLQPQMARPVTFMTALRVRGRTGHSAFSEELATLFPY